MNEQKLSNNDEVAICCFLKSITKMELLYTQEEKDHNSIIETNIQDLITPIIQMAVSYNESSSDEVSTPDAAAIDVASIITELIPEQMVPLLQQFISENITNDDEGFRSACFSFAYIIAASIQDDDLSQFASSLMDNITSVFSDPSPHVIETAMYLLSFFISKFIKSDSYDEIYPVISGLVPSFVEHINDSKEVTIIISKILIQMSEQPNFTFFTDLFRALLPVFQEINLNLVISVSMLLESMIYNHKIVDEILEIIPDYLTLYMDLVQHASEDHSFLDNQGELATLLIPLTLRAPLPFIESLPSIVDSLMIQFNETGECDSVNIVVLAHVIKNLVVKLPDKISPTIFNEKSEQLYSMCMHFISRSGNPSDIQDGCNAFIQFLKAKGLLKEFIPQLFEHMVPCIDESQESYDSIYQYIRLFYFIVKKEEQIPDNTINIIVKINEIAANIPLYGKDTLKLGYRIAKTYNLLICKYSSEAFQWVEAIFTFLLRFSKLYHNEIDSLDDDEDEYSSSPINKYKINYATDVFLSSISEFPEFPEIADEDQEYLYAMFKQIRSVEELRPHVKKYSLVFGIEFNEEEEDAE